MKPYLCYNLEKEYKDNTIWDKVIHTNFQNIEFWKNEFNSFLEFIQNEVEAIIQRKTSWTNTYHPFKKAVSALAYLNTYFSQYEYIHHNTKDKVKEGLIEIQESVNGLYSFLWTNDAIIKKFKSLKKEVSSANQKDILNSWLKNFFQDGQSFDIKKNYNKISNKLNEHISNFLENNQELYKNDNNSIYIEESNAIRVQGIKQEVLNEAKKHAKEAGLNGWLFYMTEYTAHQIIKKSSNRNFRKRAYLKYQKINRFGEFTFENGYVLKNILQEKHKIAQLFGKSNYAQLVLSNYVLNTTDKAFSYLNKIESQLASSANSVNQKIVELATKRQNL